MTIYGLFGFTHGWASVLTLMSPEGTSALLARIDPGDDLNVDGGEGRLVQVIEKRKGAHQRLIDAYGIDILSKQAWDAKKAELGDCIRR